MTAIKQSDLVQSIADALQFISYDRPRDYTKKIVEFKIPVTAA